MVKVREMDDLFWVWVSTRPKKIIQMIADYPPDILYLLKTSNRRVTIEGYMEDGTFLVSVSGEFNCVAFDRQVFGVLPDDLEECDLPEEKEKLGTFLKTDKEVEQFLDHVCKKGHPEK